MVLAILVSLRASTAKAQVLAEDNGLVVLQSREPQRVPDCGAQQLDRKNQILKNFRIVVLAVRKEEKLQHVLRCFGPSWEQVPFREKNGVVQIPTGEIFVKFKEGTSKGVIQKIFENNGLRVVTEPKTQNSAFKATSQSRSAARSVEVARLIGKSPFIEYAEPNWIIVRSKTP